MTDTAPAAVPAAPAPALNIELRKFKSVAWMSEETLCFRADIHVDGKKVGTVENEGHGGPCNEHFTDKAAEARFLAHIKTLPPETCDFLDPKTGEKAQIRVTADYFFATLAEAEEQKKVNKALAKKKEKFAAKCTARGQKAYFVTVGGEKSGIAYMYNLNPTTPIAPEAAKLAKKHQVAVESVVFQPLN